MTGTTLKLEIRVRRRKEGDGRINRVITVGVVCADDSSTDLIQSVFESDPSGFVWESVLPLRQNHQIQRLFCVTAVAVMDRNNGSLPHRAAESLRFPVWILSDLF